MKKGLILLGMVLTLGPLPALGEALAIVSPQQEETVHDNSGNVTVILDVADRSLLDEGTIRLLMDGQPVLPAVSPPSAHLENVDRGTHTLEAQLVTRDGEVLAQSEVITFHMWRASRLFPNRQPSVR